MDPEENSSENAGAARPNDAMDGVDEQENGNQYENELADLVIVEREIEMENDGNNLEEEEDEEEEEEWEASDREQNQEAAGNDEEEQNYEISRSSRHEYLGDTEELSGRTVVEDHDCITIPVLIPNSAHNLVLLPSQTLPLTIFCPMQQSMLRNVISKDRTIGIIHTRIGFTAGYSKFDQYGTTAEIYEYHLEEDGPSLSVKAKGRQRFKVINTERETTGCIVAKVKILPEIRMPDPLQYVRLADQLKKNYRNSSTEAGQKLKIRDKGSLRPASSWRARRQAAMLTPLPYWVYDLYDDEQLAVRLVNEIVTQFNLLEENLQIPRDPQELSHWAAINLPLTDAQRLSLLSLNTATQRLRFILSLTSNGSKGLFCSYCGRLVADTSNIFCMSTDGPQGTFVNPGGYIHEMITVTKVNRVLLQGKACTKHSWFPGYAWRIANCNTCHSHIGWYFTAEKNLKPKSFYGITRLSVKTKLTEDSNPLEYVI